METIKVNMSPNPLDVQTIHASQNDSEAREWKFELHNNGEVIDAGGITEQMVFKAYKGGTEQLLPENGSTPTTSPFLGDIRYPQGLLSDQEFTYRQSPTESDGLAKITDIKGNTLNWNQLVQNGNFESTTGWSQNDTANTLSVASNEMTVTVGNPIYTTGFYGLQMHDRIANHKYLFVVSIYSPIATTFAFGNTNDGIRQNVSVGWNTLYGLVTNTVTIKSVCCYLDCRNLSAGSTFKVKNYQAFDLTQMGLDVTAQEFVSYFPLSYYPYDSGSLLSFNGNGIKTVGKNRLNYGAWKTVETRNGTSVWENNGVTITATSNDAYTLYGASTFPENARIPVRVGETITLSWESDDNVSGDVYIFPNGGSAGFVFINNLTGKSLSYTPVSEVEYVTIRFGVTSSGNTIHYKNIMLRYDGTDSAYEPYTSSTTNLPVSTYFPTGMKSAYNSSDLTDIVRDELSQTKATRKVKQITFDGSSDESWSVESIGSGSASGQHNFYINVAPAKKISLAMNNMAVPYALYTPNYIDGKINAYVSNGENLNFYPGTDITSVADFRTWLSNHPLTVNIALPTDGYEETEFTTASLVTENEEIPLSNEDGILIGKCTEQLSSESGFFDAKIKLSDGDGDVYSNKIQLHIERSPQ